ncbi:MAG: DNA-methyltransferase [Spirochaetia bacterium]
MPPAPCSAVLYNADCRRMPEITDAGIDLVITSPPYWQIKDYGSPGQIGFGESLHEYLGDLQRVWTECFRVLRPGGRLCVNIGDQFARARVFGRYRVIPLHAEIICQCAEAGFDSMGSIIWRKKTTMNTSGGAVVMGSYPYPPNGVVEIDFEYILLFRKPGKSRAPSRETRELSALTREEWKAWFSGHWDIGGARKNGHDAPFPEEIPRRLVRMFSFRGDTVLDPFMGRGTTAKAALALGRNAVGYEIRSDFLRLAETPPNSLLGGDIAVLVPDRGRMPPAASAETGLRKPRIPDIAPAAPAASGKLPPTLHTVTAIRPDCSLVLETGAVVVLRGLEIVDHDAAAAYLRQRVLKKRVFLRDESSGEGTSCRARVILKNRISINAQLVKSGAARAVD